MCYFDTTLANLYGVKQLEFGWMQQERQFNKEGNQMRIKKEGVNNERVYNIK